ncbi:MAG: hypothetical protein H7Z43_09410 [Clostridia bacterium]|nr:hypothetical protein [Deltaproteobacteria bacterium]
MWRTAAIVGVVASVALVAAHAWGDRLNSFPDERLHIVNGEFYVEHWLPPAMTEALERYAGVHGVAYHMLWPPQATYLVFAKASLLVPGLRDTERWMCYRALCVMAWGALVISVLVHLRRSPWVFWLVGLTPGVWYVFTYFSADALSYVTASVVAVQLGLPDSMARRYLTTGKPIGGGVIFGASIGLLALSKLNYLTFSGTAFAYCCVLLWRNREKTMFARRCVLVVAIGCAVAGPFLLTDLVRNGAGQVRDARYNSLRESFAKPGFRASDITAGTAYYGYAIRQQGVSAAALFHRPWRWGLFTSRSFFGVYGTMDVDPLPLLNDAQVVLAVGLLALGYYYCRRGLARDQLVFTGVALTMCAAACAAAFWRAWVFDFQAQGRYCFAIIPSLVLLATEVCDPRQRLAHWILACLMTIAALISLASALPHLN